MRRHMGIRALLFYALLACMLAGNIYADESAKLTDSQIRQLKENLQIPDEIEVTRYWAGTPSYWEGAGLWTMPVELYSGDQLLGSASVDPNTMELMRNIYTYVPPAGASQAGSGAAAETSSIRIEGLPETFAFASGAGGWSTEMTISDDWSFAGQFHDSDMGDTGDGYPNGTLYISDFSGAFSGQEWMSSYALKMKLFSLDCKQKENEESITDGIRRIGATPYGIYGGDEFILYLPGTPVSELTEDCMSWIRMFLNYQEPAELPEGFFVLYNVHEGTAFVGQNDDRTEAAG